MGRLKPRLPIKTDLDAQIAILTENLAPIEDEISQLRAEATQEQPFVLSDYESRHPEYKGLAEQKSSKQALLHKVNCLIYDLNSFLSILNNSLSKLDEVKHKEAA